MQRISVARGIEMPFFPMRPVTGRVIRNRCGVASVLEAIKDIVTWEVQPKLGGDRACLAVVGGSVHIQNRHGGWYGHEVYNANAWLKLDDRTLLDGEVFRGSFYPFEMLVTAGKPLLLASTSQRVVMARYACRLCDEKWMFAPPPRDWLLRLKKNLPDWDGVVLKRRNAHYVFNGSATQTNSVWMKRLW